MIKTNHVEIIVGTINNFSSPDFLEAMKKAAKKATKNEVTTKTSGISLYVDFRGSNSVHWKLALIEPTTVVIGSANLTKRGVGLDRDTCVVIEDVRLYRSYVKMVNALKASKDVISSNDKSFNRRLTDYRAKHDAMQQGLRIAGASAANTLSFEAWLDNDVNQQITLYIWEFLHTDATKDTANKITKDTLGVMKKAEASGITGDKIRDFFTYDEQPIKPPFENGDIVLCCNKRGSQMDFYTFDIVTRGTIRDYNGSDYCGYYMIALKKSRYKCPFDLKPHKSALKKLIKEKVDGKETGKVTIKRHELVELLK